MFSDPAHRVRVVFVEEHEDSRETVALALSIAGFEVRSFASPTEALAAIERDAPHVVITSIVLPEMRGDDLARLVKLAPLPRRPAIVAATGVSDACSDEGRLFDRVLIKPLDVDRLVEEVRELAARDGRPSGGGPREA